VESRAQPSFLQPCPPRYEEWSPGRRAGKVRNKDEKKSCGDADPDPELNFHFDADPDPNRSFQIKAQNLEKSAQKVHIPYILACRLQIDEDADPDPACHFDADPDPTFQFNADPDPQHI
jgi:hypothetical protein